MEAACPLSPCNMTMTDRNPSSSLAEALTVWATGLEDCVALAYCAWKCARSKTVGVPVAAVPATPGGCPAAAAMSKATGVIGSMSSPLGRLLLATESFQAITDARRGGRRVGREIREAQRLSGQLGDLGRCVLAGVDLVREVGDYLCLVVHGRAPGLRHRLIPGLSRGVGGCPGAAQ